MRGGPQHRRPRGGRRGATARGGGGRPRLGGGGHPGRPASRGATRRRGRPLWPAPGRRVGPPRTADASAPTGRRWATRGRPARCGSGRFGPPSAGGGGAVGGSTCGGGFGRRFGGRGGDGGSLPKRRVGVGRRRRIGWLRGGGYPPAAPPAASARGRRPALGTAVGVGLDDCCPCSGRGRGGGSGGGGHTELLAVGGVPVGLRRDPGPDVVAREGRGHRTANGYHMRAKDVFWPWDNL